MAGKKSITLLNKQGNPISKFYRYKKLRSAVKKAVDLSVRLPAPVQIWHLDKGKELALVKRTNGRLEMDIPHPRTFDNLWSEA
jgi:hypothetical protein